LDDGDGQPEFGKGYGRQYSQIGLVEDDDDRDIAALALEICRSAVPGTVSYNRPQIGAVETLRVSGSARRACVIDTAVSMNRTGPRGRSSIGFSTGSVVRPAADNGDLLARDRVEDAGLADITAAEQAIYSRTGARFNRLESFPDRSGQLDKTQTATASGEINCSNCSARGYVAR
jgi:hypothetical protein